MQPHKPQRRRDSGCDGKHPFDSYRIALEVSRRARNKTVRYDLYHCEFCSKWHIGQHLATKGAFNRAKGNRK